MRSECVSGSSAAGGRSIDAAFRHELGVMSDRQPPTALFFHPGRHLLAAVNYREIMRRRFAEWRELVYLQTAL